MSPGTDGRVTNSDRHEMRDHAMFDEPPTEREISAVSDDPHRFERMLPTATEVIAFADRQGGRIPAYVYRLSDRRWDELGATLRELDALTWLRAVAA